MTRNSGYLIHLRWTVYLLIIVFLIMLALLSGGDNSIRILKIIPAPTERQSTHEER
jgi:hypothetical protein